MIEVDRAVELMPFVDKELGVSDWTTIDRQMITSFGRVTGDTHWVHMDDERAKLDTPFGGVIAHGFLVLSLVTALSTQCFKIRTAQRWFNYGLERVRFTAPVTPGARLRMRLSLAGAGEQAGGTRLQMGCTIEMEGSERPAAVCEWICIVFDGETV